MPSHCVTVFVAIISDQPSHPDMLDSHACSQGMNIEGHGHYNPLRLYFRLERENKMCSNSLGGSLCNQHLCAVKMAGV